MSSAPTSPNTLSSVETTFCTQHPLDNLDLLKEILLFVGPNQFRFIAGINPRFRDAYQETFPDHTFTYWNASTMENAKFCRDELIYFDPILYYLPDHNPEIQLCRSAARHGNLRVLQFLRALDFEWDERVCASAARYGHLEVLQWCREHGCPWDATTCKCATLNGYWNVLQWCRANGCPCHSISPIVQVDNFSITNLGRDWL